ncbi:MAG: hypothetical protein R3F17_13815, partial [Planctomycetota bacterium]
LKEAQAKALALQTVYSTLDMLESDIAATNKSMADVRLEQERIKRQISLQDSPLGNPFDELELVQASDKPTEPNAWLLSAVSVLLGIGTGMGLALVLEYSKNCFRSINDIAQSMEVPVLGAVNKIETRKQRNMRHMRKVVMSVALALLVAVVSYTLYAWVLNPSLLTPSLVDSIDRLREALG